MTGLILLSKDSQESSPAPQFESINSTKINSKWIKDLNVRPETIKLLEENIGKTLSEVHHSRILYDPPSIILVIKAKINKLDLIKLKSFFTTKKNYKQGEKTAFRMGENNSK